MQKAVCWPLSILQTTSGFASSSGTRSCEGWSTRASRFYALDGRGHTPLKFTLDEVWCGESSSARCLFRFCGYAMDDHGGKRAVGGQPRHEATCGTCCRNAVKGGSCNRRVGLNNRRNRSLRAKIRIARDGASRCGPGQAKGIHSRSKVP